jgi:hypothetical protein
MCRSIKAVAAPFVLFIEMLAGPPVDVKFSEDQ